MGVSRETSPAEEGLRQLILEEAPAVFSGLSPATADLLARHLLWVLQENSRLNLTSITEPTEGVRLHVLDSLAVAAHVPEGAHRLCDLGSGQGYPGIPIALATQKKMLLLEPRKKRARFLRKTIEKLGAQERISVSDVRSEEYARSHPPSMDVVVARAVAELATVVELSAPLLRLSGRLFAMKGKPSAEEMERADRAAALCGMKQDETIEYMLPDGVRRTLVCYQRIGDSSRDLPRRPGVAQKKPLV